MSPVAVTGTIFSIVEISTRSAVGGEGVKGREGEGETYRERDRNRQREREKEIGS